MTAPTLRKRERMVSRKLIETLFGANQTRHELLPGEARGSHSMAAFPLRIVYMKRERPDGEAPVQLLVSVSKKRFKHAVDRNRAKRQVREAYRQHKQLVYDVVLPKEQLLIAFVWLSDEYRPSWEVEKRVVGLLQRVAEKL